jgi:hypothetical protein
MGATMAYRWGNRVGMGGQRTIDHNLFIGALEGVVGMVVLRPGAHSALSATVAARLGQWSGAQWGS